MKGQYLFIILTCFNYFLSAQECQIKEITVRDGLTMAYISSLAEAKNQYIWIGTYFGLNRYDGRNITQFKPDHFDPWGLHANIIFSIAEDQNGLLWLGTEQGLAVMEPVTERFVLLSEINKSVSRSRVSKVHISQNGNIWALQEDKSSQWVMHMSTNASLKAYFRSGNKSTLRITGKKIDLPKGFDGKAKLFYPINVNQMLLKDEANIYYLLNLNTEKIDTSEIFNSEIAALNESRIVSKIDGKYGILISKNNDRDELYADIRSELIITPDNKKLICNFYDSKIRLYQHDTYNTKLNTDNLPIYCEIDKPCSGAKLLDAKGNIWIGTTGYGLRIISQNKSASFLECKGVSFYNLAVLPGQNIWPGYQHQDKLYAFSEKKIITTPWNTSLTQSESVLAVLYSKKYNACFLVIKNTENQSLRLREFSWKSRKLLPRSIPLLNYSPAPPALFEDSQGNIWVANIKGELVRYNPSTEIVDQIPLTPYYPSDLINEINTWDIIQSGPDEIWLANSLGLIKVSQVNTLPKITTYTNKPDKKIFKNNGIFCLSQDHIDPNLLWLGTLGNGLASFDKKSEIVTYYEAHKKNNLNIIAGMEATDNLLWLATDFEIVCFDKVSRKFIPIKNQYFDNDTDFNVMASGQVENNQLVFGTTNGLVKFRKENLLYDTDLAPIHLVSLDVNNLDIRQLVNNDMLTVNSDSSYQLSIPYNQNSINMIFGSPASRYANEINFEYRLHKSDTLWHPMYKGYILNLADLNPGSYNMEVRIANKNISNAKVLAIHLNILPPWYLSTVAKCLYFIFLIFALSLIFLYDRKRIQLSYEARLHQAEVSKLKLLGKQKNRFIAYLAHEFKTPLALISSITKLKTFDSIQTINSSNTLLIQRESDNMLRIIDELIDMSKLDEGILTPHLVNGNINQLLKDVCASLNWWIADKNIKIEEHFSEDPLLTQFDPKRMRYILNNIILNAIRFSHQNGIIQLSTKKMQDEYCISIRDFGVGMKPEEIPNIFNAFFQGKGAENNPYTYGLGLSFVKDLIHFLGGNISVSSVRNVRTEFSLNLPLEPWKTGLEEYISIQQDSNNPPEQIETLYKSVDVNKKKPICLIVEDNEEMQSLIFNYLSPYFKTLVASNGEEGLATAVSEIPDVILTDVIMPKMDGLQMTHAIKTNTLTSHIPVVMLSSLSSTEDKIKGQLEGAEGYIPKPFHPQELILQLYNLLKLQENWKRRYNNQDNNELVNLELSDVFSTNSIERTDQFMQSLMSLFEDHFHSESLDSDEIAKLLHISRPQLYRKIAAISDISVMELLRNFRLEKASQMLIHKPFLSIKEVAFNTGFKERNHFTKSFLNKYDMTPSDWKIKHNPEYRK